MKRKNPRAGLGAGASEFHRAGDVGIPTSKPLNPQLFALASGGVIDRDSAADALEWGKALEVAAGFWLQRRRRHG